MARRVAKPGQARGKQDIRFRKGGFTFETDKGFETELLHSAPVRELAEAKAAELAVKMIRAAPLGPHRFTTEYAIKNNVHAYVEDIGTGWVGYVVVEENEKARHAMLQERGYRDPSGRRHKGRFFFKKVLEQERTD
ncbi:hypothetical protein ACFYW9_19305 [Streptomyces sp. NPDC002698]|uniref:hypothetical protein n=1 Tax=Streptomyces sp. NPDC002698 TaxID=3364660 RepID=UPI00369544BC